MRLEDAAAAALTAVMPQVLPPLMPQVRPPLMPDEAGTMPADQRLREFFRLHPALGKRERVQIADWVFDVLRNLRLYRELAPAEDPRALIDVARAAAGQLYGSGTSFNHLNRDLMDRGRIMQFATQLPAPIRYSLPGWLWERLEVAHGERTGPIAHSLLQAAPIDLRANLLVGKAAVLRQKLTERGVESVPIDGVPTGLRVVGRPNLEQLDLFQRGWFEIQDAGSQRIVDVCDVRRGQLVIDFCAGAGGKTLAIAARLRNMGKVLAFDTGDERLSRLMPRASRSGADIVTAMRITGLGDPRLSRYVGRADVVLVDAPCSGTGTLRRSPDLKWRLTPERLLLHVQEQQAILAAASALVKPGGHLVYATCSLLREENESQVERFGAAAAAVGGAEHPPAAGPQTSRMRPGFQLAHQEHWLPDAQPSSGFFVAKWLLRAAHNSSPRTIQ